MMMFSNGWREDDTTREQVGSGKTVKQQFRSAITEL